MKAIGYLFVLVLFAVASSCAHAETPQFTCPGHAVDENIPNTDIHVVCVGTTPDPPQCIPPSVPAGFGLCACNPPNTAVNGVCTAPVVQTGCDPSQLSYTRLARQCSGSVWYQYPAPRTLSYSGAFENADSILGGTWGHYKASGFSFYTDIQFGYYISFALKALDATHAINVAVNQTWGANGHFWVSDVPGGPPRGACIFADNTNAWLWPLAGYQCSIPVNQTVYLNWSANEVANGRIGYGVQ